MSLPPHLSSSTSSQTSKGCGAPETPAPTAPETETDSTRPDVIPPVYDDLNTLSRKGQCSIFLWLSPKTYVNDVLNAEGEATITANVSCVGSTYSC